MNVVNLQNKLYREIYRLRNHIKQVWAKVIVWSKAVGLMKQEVGLCTMLIINSMQHLESYGAEQANTRSFQFKWQ